MKFNKLFTVGQKACILIDGGCFAWVSNGHFIVPLACTVYLPANTSWHMTYEKGMFDDVTRLDIPAASKEQVAIYYKDRSLRTFDAYKSHCLEYVGHMADKYFSEDICTASFDVCLVAEIAKVYKLKQLASSDARQGLKGKCAEGVIRWQVGGLVFYVGGFCV